jgi:hypothetical protein
MSVPDFVGEEVLQYLSSNSSHMAVDTESGEVGTAAVGELPCESRSSCPFELVTIDLLLLSSPWTL